MIPTYGGRFQTRLFLVSFVALPWTLLITPLLPTKPGGGSVYPVTLAALAIVLVVGMVVWESVYYLLQIMRWEKDWPSMFFMLQVVPEAIVAWWILKWIGPHSDVATLRTFVWHIVTTWIVMWLFALGPIKVLLIRWRFNGGRIFW